MVKKEKELQRRDVKRILVIWGILGLIGAVWIVHMLVIGIVGIFEKDTEEDTGYKAVVQADEQISQEQESGAVGVLEGTEQWNDEAELDRQTGNRTDSERGENGAKVSESGIIWVEAEKYIRKEDCQAVYEANEKLLTLINREHALDEGTFEDSLRSICNGRLQASDYLYDDLVDLLAAAKEEGYQYWIASAYRSRDRQQELVDEDVARYMNQGMNREQALEKTYEQTMPAGKSEHESGLALDILCSENLNMDVTQATEPGNQWLAAHAHEYGFILRYPADKEDITGISYEPWHFRYVGKEAAAFLWEKELTLEEFYEYLDE